MPHTRRTFLAAAAATVAAPRPSGGSPHRAGKRILVLGGTRYLGPAIVSSAVERGHTVTLFNRGRSNPQLFPQLEKLEGQRRRKGTGSDVDQDLTALHGREWDAVVDTSAYFTGEVEDMADLLRDSVGFYAFVSSLSVYRDLGVNDSAVTEDSPKATIDDVYTAKITETSYGALKFASEEAVAARFPGRAALVRPGYIVGPDDPFDRLTSRLVRIARGGDTLAPGDPQTELQMIDVRDLGAFIVRLVEDGTAGPCNAVGYDGHITVGDFHSAAKCTLQHKTRFEWVSDEFLDKHGVTSWQEISCWTPRSKYNHAHIDRAVAAGLQCRALTRTIDDTYRWAVEERPADRPWRGGMEPGREKELLAAWRAR